MRLDADALRSGLAGKRIGWPLHCFETVDSTNRVAMRLAREGAAEGTAVLADGQTDGKGRLRRGWQSPPGCNLYLSVILRPALAVPEISRITLLAGVAAAETIASACPQGGVGIKWPNDVRIRGRKACGILAETSPAGGSQVVVLGIGMNVNIRRRDFDPGHRNSATSLLEETGKVQSREALACLLCGRLHQWYATFMGEGFPPVREAWMQRSDMTGKRVRVLFRNEVKEGTATGIDLDGALILAGPQGEILRIVAGDATILKE